MAARPRPLPLGKVMAAGSGSSGVAMNVCEATATNLVLGTVLGMSAVGAVPVSDEDAEQAAHFLGNRAYKTPDGKQDGEVVTARWARRFHSGNPVCERCTDVKDAVARCDGCADALCRQCWGDGDALFCAACWHRRRPAFDDVIVRSGIL